MNKRELRLSKYGISNNRYAELRSFCKQYPEWKDELRFKNDTVKSPSLSGMPHVQGKGNQTENLAIRRAMLTEKCELIESVARKASPDLWEYIIKSVCYEKTVVYLRTIMGMPCNERSFYDVRRYFFYLLDKSR